jgi:hypothetical protein
MSIDENNAKLEQVVKMPEESSARSKEVSPSSKFAPSNMPLHALRQEVGNEREETAHSGGREYSRIVLLSSNRQFNSLDNCDRLRDPGSLTVVLDSRLCKEFRNCQSLGFNWVRLEDIVNERKAWTEALTKSKTILDSWKKFVFEGKSVFSDMLGFDGASLLEIDSSRYLSSHFGVLPEIIRKTDILATILGTFNPRAVILSEPYSDWELVAESLCESRGVAREFVGEPISRSLTNAKDETMPFVTIQNHQLEIPLLLIPLAYFTRYCLKSILARLDPHCRKDDDIYTMAAFTFNEKCLDVLVPLCNSLRTKHGWETLVLLPPKSGAEEDLDRHGIKHRRVEDYVTFGASFRASLAHLRIIRRYLRLNTNSQFNQRMYRIEGILMSQLLSRHIDMTIAFAGSSIINITTIQRILKKHHSRLLFMPHFSENEINSFAYGARRLSIPVVELHRGTTGISAEYSIFMGNRLLVGGTRASDAFKEWGIKPELIVATGLPIFDNLIHLRRHKEAVASKLRDQLGLHEECRIVCYLTQSLGNRFDNNARIEEIGAIFKAAMKVVGVHLIVKLHPTEKDVDIYKRIADELQFSRLSIVREELSLDEVVLCSDVAVTKNSTSGYNALIAGCRVIVVDFQNRGFEGNPFVEGGVALSATTEKELTQRLEGLIQGARLDSSHPLDVSRLVENAFGKLDTKSIERISRSIFEIVE